jgi:hypothetical protein
MPRGGIDVKERGDVMTCGNFLCLCVLKASRHRVPTAVALVFRLHEEESVAPTGEPHVQGDLSELAKVF